MLLTKGRRCAMLEPAELYELTEAEVPAAAPVLIVALEGFVDAGNAARLAVGAMAEGQEKTARLVPISVKRRTGHT